MHGLWFYYGVIPYLLQLTYYIHACIVFLNPSGNLTVCPNEIATFTCKTWGGALVWVTSGDNTEQVFNVATQASSDLGIFRLSVNGVQINDMMVVDVNSTARTIVGFRLEDDSTTLSCLVGSDFTRKDAVLRVAGMQLLV